MQSDKILAISGVAEVYSHLLHDDYLAGLWKSCLPLALLWKVILSYYYLAGVVDCSVRKVNKSAPFGAIFEGSGRLKIKGRMTAGVCVEKSTSSWSSQRNENSVCFYIGDDPINGAGIGTMFSDIETPEPEKIDSIEVRGGNIVYVLEIVSFIAGSAWTCKGLVLTRSSTVDGVYSRIGMFKSENNMRLEGEEAKRDPVTGRYDANFEEMAIKKARLEYDWFARFPVSIVEIV